MLDPRMHEDIYGVNGIIARLDALEAKSSTPYRTIHELEPWMADFLEGINIGCCDWSCVPEDVQEHYSGYDTEQRIMALIASLVRQSIKEESS